MHEQFSVVPKEPMWGVVAPTPNALHAELIPFLVRAPSKGS
jgi:hypothetical protein